MRGEAEEMELRSETIDGAVLDASENAGEVMDGSIGRAEAGKVKIGDRRRGLSMTVDSLLS